jgi:hyperosmotically inducible protein
MRLATPRSFAAPIAIVAALTALLSGCEKRTTTTESPSGTTSTTSVSATPAASQAMSSAKDAAVQTGAAVEKAADKTGAALDKAADKTGAAVGKAADAAGDAAVTAKVKTALLADPDVKALQIDVDTRDGVVTLRGSVSPPTNVERAVAIAKGVNGVKSVDNKLTAKS